MPPSSQLIAPTSSQVSSTTFSDHPDDGNAAQDKLKCIKDLVEDLMGQCRICWVRGEVNRPHSTFCCHTGIFSVQGWRTFKAGVMFPKGVVCYFCFVPFGPLFNHVVPAPGTRYLADLCDYPDVLKELVYVLFQDVYVLFQDSALKTIFSLGWTPPSLSMGWCFKGLLLENIEEGYLGCMRSSTPTWIQEKRPSLCSTTLEVGQTSMCF
jgi:hypothetical protein